MNRQMHTLLQIHALPCSRPVLALDSAMEKCYAPPLSGNSFTASDPVTASFRRGGIQLRLPRITNLKQENVRWLNSAQNVAPRWEKG